MKGVLIVSPKGGVGKTSLCHLLAIGAAWKDVPAYVMHTDDRKPLKVDGRPYMYYDARDPETLTRLMGAALNNNGLCVIDSGGNRAEFDAWLADSVDLVLIPVIPDTEAVDIALEHMERLEQAGARHVRFLLNAVSGYRNERDRDFEKYFSRLPNDKIIGQVKKVAAIKQLRDPDDNPFQTPPSHVNNLARTFYFTVKGALDSLESIKESVKRKAIA